MSGPQAPTWNTSCPIGTISRLSGWDNRNRPHVGHSRWHWILPKAVTVGRQAIASVVAGFAVRLCCQRGRLPLAINHNAQSNPATSPTTPRS